MIAGATWIVFMRWKKIPEPVVILACGAVGLLLTRL